ncbi:hypothetical protein QMK95_27475, partial [Klebsiella pneumoniae]
RIDSSKPTCRQNRCCKNGSDHRFRFLRRPHERLHAMSEWIYRTLPPDEAYWCTSERLKALAIQHLYQLDLALSPPD